MRDDRAGIKKFIAALSIVLIDCYAVSLHLDLRDALVVIDKLCRTLDCQPGDMLEAAGITPARIGFAFQYYRK